MPSWIRERDGIEWYDERYSCSQTNKTPAELAKKVKEGKLRAFNLKGTIWFARPDIEELRANFQKRSQAAKKRPPSQKQLEARYKKEAEELRKTSRHFHGGPLLAHANRVTIAEIFAAKKSPESAEKKPSEDS